MALYRYFKTADSVLPAPTGSLSTSISPAAIKDANEAVKSAVTPRSKSRGAYAYGTPSVSKLILRHHDQNARSHTSLRVATYVTARSEKSLRVARSHSA